MRIQKMGNAILGRGAILRGLRSLLDAPSDLQRNVVFTRQKFLTAGGSPKISEHINTLRSVLIIGVL